MLLSLSFLTQRFFRRFDVSNSQVVTLWTTYQRSTNSMVPRWYCIPNMCARKYLAGGSS